MTRVRFLSEIKFYFKQYCLDHDSLSTRAELMNRNVDELSEIVKNEILPEYTQNTLFEALMAKGDDYNSGEQITSVSSWISNVDGLLNPITISFAAHALNYMLERLERISIKLSRLSVNAKNMQPST